MKKILIIMLNVWSVQVLAQSSSVGWSTFSAGSASSSSLNTRVQSVVGQSFVGTTQQAGTQVISGFLADTLLRGTVVGVKDHPALPARYALDQNYPNPFNPTTTIGYALPENSHVMLEVYSVLGQRVMTLKDGVENAGHKTVQLDASQFASGIYIYRFSATSASDPTKRFTQVGKMLLLK